LWKQTSSLGRNTARFAAMSQARLIFLGITTTAKQLIARKETIFLKSNMAAGQTVPENLND
jgi:hypothetical protein